MQYDRYQPLYQRIVNDEIPDTAAPPDGRFWKAGVAQGVTTNPYERRMALSGHRKPIVIGPRSIQVVVDGEGHTLANVVRDVAWTQYVALYLLHASTTMVTCCYFFHADLMLCLLGIPWSIQYIDT